MGRIKGHYEWDNDNLTPGAKKEGGLHQNLFDSDGNLKGSARFIPDDSTDPEPVVVTETIYIPAEERRTTEEEDALRQAIVDLVSALALRGAFMAKPYVEQWWRETARPALSAQTKRLRERRTRRKARRDDAREREAESQPSKVPEIAPERPKMSKSEAQARLLAALAARTYSDEQMRLVHSSAVLDIQDLAELHASLSALPPAHLTTLLDALIQSPELLSEDALADLASILGRNQRMIDPAP